MHHNALITANTSFAFKLFAQLERQESERNVFISPASIALALAMAYNGARDETQRAMAAALELGGMSSDELNRAGAALLDQLAQLDPQVTLAIANALWARAGVAFDPDFLSRNAASYRAELTSLDFAAPDSVARINAWVGQQTRGKISSIVDQLDPRAALLLINAIYFKGSWSTAFDRALTRELPFTRPGGAQRMLPMMRRSGEWSYYWDGQLAGISIPYGAGRVCMDIFLPDEKGSLAAFLSTLDSARWQSWLSRFRKAEGTLVLPRFKLSYEITLNAALTALGMGLAFDPRRADFSGITQAEQVSISQVRHKSFVEVNEEGTEAAAVTSVEIRALGMRMGQDRRFMLIVDRPFFCVIRDTQTNTILFMGSIVEP